MSDWEPMDSSQGCQDEVRVASTNMVSVTSRSEWKKNLEASKVSSQFPPRRITQHVLARKLVFLFIHHYYSSLLKLDISDERKDDAGHDGRYLSDVSLFPVEKCSPRRLGDRSPATKHSMQVS